MVDFSEYNTEYIDKCLLPYYKERAGLSRFSTKELKVHTYYDCYFLPLKYQYPPTEIFKGGVCDAEGNVIEEAKFLPNRVLHGYDFNPVEVKYDDREVIYIGAFWQHWGHFILEQVSRLYYFLQETDPSLPIVYLGINPLSGNFLEFFELMGIDTNRLERVDDITRFRKVHIPDASVVVINDDDKSLWSGEKQDSFYTKEYAQIFERVKRDVEPKKSGYEKVFFSRKDFDKAKTKDFGQIREIESFFERIGYKIISPETLSLREQISILKSAKKFVSIAGTLPHNLLFANKDIEAIILNKSYVINAHQQLIDDLTGIRPLYIDAHLSFVPEHIGWGPFFLYISDNLIKWAKDNGYSIERGDISEYFNTFIKYYFDIAANVIYTYGIDITKRKCFDYYLNQIEGHFFKKLLIKNYAVCKLLLRLRRIQNVMGKFFMVISYKLANLF